MKIKMVQMGYVVVAGVAATLLFLNSGRSPQAEELTATLYKSPYCGCCTGYGQYLKKMGFRVEEKKTSNMASVKHSFGISPELESCHTSEIGGYVVEGHVPVNVIQQLLQEKPEIRGIALPGMPTGVPGMPGPKEELVFYTIEEKPQVYKTK